ncbi:MAG: heme anaerobic degradation radical SAM methyltransferase ChuW/HutW [Desulfovibrio sp.]|jgi:oxygen-independent coproporphyrinogen-3 oxidase|nr:heme anaerobic degradation radical SAM methyltransferase ChuW/HutW [Desulfovibrio sp.]
MLSLPAGHGDPPPPGLSAETRPSPHAPSSPKARPRGLNILSLNPARAHGNHFARITGDPLSGAFSSKTAVHAGMGGRPVPQGEIPAALEKLRNTPRRGAAAAYVHVPYCETRCTYCGFFGGKYTPEAGAAYVRTLTGEIESESPLPCVASSPVNALYIGGGTPTALEAKDLAALLRALRSALPLANDCEITVEGRLHSFGEDKIEACLREGVNRFSLGVQSFNTELRRGLGRLSSREEIIGRLRALAAYNQAAIVLDLIYGLPGQTLKDWEEELRTFLELPLDGVDLYQLNIFPGSLLAKGVEAGKIPPPAPLAEQGKFFALGVSLLQGARCRRISMSHWNCTARERNLYNPLAKSRADCLHYGAGAGGFLQGWFMYNHSNVESYSAKRARGEKPVAALAAPPDNLPLMRLILEQMEQCRLNLDMVGETLSRLFGAEADEARALYAPLLENWEEAGLIARDGPWMELTLAGQFWQVNITQAFLERLTDICVKK